MFCTCDDSPLGIVVVYSPAVVDTYKICPSEKLEVSIFIKLPSVTICKLLLALASSIARPNAGILEASSALALLTVAVLPDTPDT